MSTRNRTSSKIIGYGLHLYFLGLSFRNAAKALSFLKIIKISHVSIWKWIQKYRLKRFQNNKKIKECIIDETAIKTGSKLVWIWIVIEPKDKEILATDISKKRNMFVAERVLSEVVNKYGSHSVSSDGGTRYPQACRFLKLKHHLHSYYEKSIIERTTQYVKARTDNLMITFLAKRKNVN